MAELIIFGCFILAAFVSGFYCGYLKREEKPPPVEFKLPDIKGDIAAVIAERKKTDDDEDNISFFN